ncbi:hypothetical protein UFOVP257_298 [uncultured Caudovirales phage]|uniref:Uncharacterized protein n=1 Tax=uncultured Caudovirales phage TaxID=2100421 RepID=A0A6J5LKB8_9CAUD|nr:hypothetical protein UFOVP257_298 [uncultured Caudovirales phage]
MVIPKISHVLLKELSQYTYRAQAINAYKHKNDLDEQYKEKNRLLELQEFHRVIKNYNYMKDTEELRQYAFGESIKEQRLVQRSAVRGIFVDRYI